MASRIRRRSLLHRALIKNARNIRIYNDFDVFSGKKSYDPIPHGDSENGILYLIGLNKYTLRVHDRLWYEFDAVVQGFPNIMGDL